MSDRSADHSTVHDVIDNLVTDHHEVEEMFTELEGSSGLEPTPSGAAGSPPRSGASDRSRTDPPSPLLQRRRRSVGTGGNHAARASPCSSG